MICSLLIFLGFDPSTAQRESEILRHHNPEDAESAKLAEAESLRKKENPEMHFINYRRYKEDETMDQINSQITSTYDDALPRLLKFSDKIMDYYAEMRTKNGKGITIQSQIRFLRMYTLYLFNRFKLQPLREHKDPFRDEDDEEDQVFERVQEEEKQPNSYEDEEIEGAAAEKRRNYRTKEEEREREMTKFTFYKDVFTALGKRSLDEIKPSKNLPLLAPLRVSSRDEADYNNIKIKLYKVTCVGYK